MFRCLLFDIDGTLLDTRYASLLAAQQAFEEIMGKRFSFEELEYTFGVPTLSAAVHYGCQDPDAYIARVDELYTQYGKDHNCVFPDIRETLDELRAKGVPMGIATSKTRWEYHHDFDLYDLTGYFIHPVTADDTQEHKPLPAPVNKFCELSGFRKDEILYIGDMIHDYSCASGAGVAFAFAGWSGNSPLPQADYQLREPSDLLTFV